MPELPEVESARQVVERAALQRRISAVDDRDTWECRPHSPGEIADALVGLHLVAAHRRGKTMWCATAGDDGTPGAVLGLHLGMSGRILVSPPQDSDDGEQEGGDYLGSDGERHGGARKEEWYRFTLDFEDGGRMRLFDKRRLGRVRLDPDLASLGPDAEEIDREAFRERVGRGSTPIKARLLDQATLAGVGNLLADETLWQAGIDPRRPSEDLTIDDLDELRRSLRKAIRLAHRHGGVHTGEVIASRRSGAECPRCGTEMTSAKVGGRTTWWCPKDQA